MEENELIPVDNNNAVEYTDDNIRHLSDMEHVRTRPGMYIGRLGDGAPVSYTHLTLPTICSV